MAPHAPAHLRPHAVRRPARRAALALTALLLAAPGASAVASAQEAPARVTARAVAGPQVYVADALKTLNAARAKRDRRAVSPEACLTRSARQIARRDAEAGRTLAVDAQAVYRRCEMHYVAGANAVGSATGAATIRRTYLADAGIRALLLDSDNRLTGMGAARAEDGTWFFMVWVADYRTR